MSLGSLPEWRQKRVRGSVQNWRALARARGSLWVVLAWALTLGWMGLIFWLSSLPDLPGPEGELGDAALKKLGHLVEYGILSGLLWWALRVSFRLRPPRLYTTALLLSLLYAASDEVHQAFVPGRTASPFDLGIDALGILAVLGAIWMIGRSLPSQGPLHSDRIDGGKV